MIAIENGIIASYDNGITINTEPVIKFQELEKVLKLSYDKITELIRKYNINPYCETAVKLRLEPDYYPTNSADYFIVMSLLRNYKMSGYDYVWISFYS